MFKSAGLAKMFAGRRKFFRGPHVRHLCSKALFLCFNVCAPAHAKAPKNLAFISKIVN